MADESLARLAVRVALPDDRMEMLDEILKHVTTKDMYEKGWFSRKAVEKAYSLAESYGLKGNCEMCTWIDDCVCGRIVTIFWLKLDRNGGEEDNFKDYIVYDINNRFSEIQSVKQGIMVICYCSKCDEEYTICRECYYEECEKIGGNEFTDWIKEKYTPHIATYKCPNAMFIEWEAL